MSDTANGVIVRLASGAEYGLKNAETAKAIYPGGEIISYADGRPYVETHAEGDAPATVTLDGETVTLEKIKRDELNELAPSLGVEDPKAYGKKEELIEAILAAQERLTLEVESSGVNNGGPDA